MNKKIIIEGMRCAHCTDRVSQALKNICGVKEVVVSIENKVAVVELAHDVESGKFIEAVENIGKGYKILDIFNE